MERSLIGRIGLGSARRPFTEWRDLLREASLTAMVSVKCIQVIIALAIASMTQAGRVMYVWEDVFKARYVVVHGQLARHTT